MNFTMCKSAAHSMALVHESTPARDCDVHSHRTLAATVDMSAEPSLSLFLIFYAYLFSVDRLKLRLHHLCNLRLNCRHLLSSRSCTLFREFDSRLFLRVDACIAVNAERLQNTLPQILLFIRRDRNLFSQTESSEHHSSGVYCKAN